MPIQFDKFDQQKIERLKTHLESQAAKGNPKFYEIYVDSLKAVQKTDDPKEFEGYENYMTPETNQIKVLIYNSGSSPRNDQFVFAMRAKSSQEALEYGLDGISARSLSKTELVELKEKREAQLAESQRIAELKDEIEDLLGEIDEKNHYIERLEKVVEAAKENGNKIGGIKLSDILSEALEGFVRKNTSILAQIPGLNGVAEIIEKDTAAKQSLNGTGTTQSEVTFTKKNPSPDQTLSDQERQFLVLFKELQKHFNEQEMTAVFEILDRLSADKEKIKTVQELLR